MAACFLKNSISCILTYNKFVALNLHNTLTNSVQEFVPLEPGKVKMYHCGPTVYDYVHIGNLRSFLLGDLLRRTFDYLGYSVTQVMNITDVGIGGNNDEGEDKIVSGLKREGKAITMENMKELSDFYTERFKEDIGSMNIKLPHHLPKASEHIEEDIKMIQVLESKGFTYETEDGLYFDTSKDSRYGRLGKLGKETESRVENSSKKNSRDFALWKKNTNLGYPSPWGQGFPGWHIECSAMATKYLGPSLDIHTGGLDLAPVHHNNEIAQSESACGCEFARYWLHNEFVNVPEGKMAKSEGSGITLAELRNAQFSPLAYRYFLLMAHYRTPVTFTWEALEAANNAFTKLKRLVDSWPDGGKVDEAYKALFVEKIENDLNTPQALAVLWTLVKDKEVKDEDKKATAQDFCRVYGLGL